ncbi:MAG TPA: immunoglobulin domain-containing protein [Candidatus Angelobacter sp.]|nr:immunoglobulin domain-containing protein [Candidatus Angelobacter sp.]
MESLKRLAVLCLFGFLLANANAQSFLTNGLVAYYPFHGNANDASGNGNNGTNYGATFVPNRFGFANAAAYFNQSHILTGFFPPLGTAARTFSGWFQVPASPNAMAILAYGGNSSYPGDRFELDLGYHIPGSFLLNVSYDGGWTPTNYDDSNWHSFAVVVPTNATLSNAVVYMDGILQTNLYLSGSADTFNTSEVNPLQFGQEYLGGGFGPLAGSLSDIRVYNRALSSNEVVQLYAYESIPPIQITQNLTNTSVVAGGNISFKVSAAGTSPISYQWYSTAPNYLMVAGAYAELTGDFVYPVVVTNGGNGYGTAPSVSFPGGGGTGAAGVTSVSNGILTSITITNPGYGYSTAPSVVVGPPNGFIFGATNSVLNITNAGAGDAGSYYVVVSSSSGTITSDVAALTILYPPAISNQPQDDLVYAYNPASFNVTATGTPPLSYQWTFGGSNVLNATDSTLSIASAQQSNLGQYQVIITNTYGSITSSIANLYMYPYLEMPFSGAVTYWGQTNVLSVGAWGSGNLSYQWYLDGVPIPEATASNLVLSGIQFTNAGSYSVVVSNSHGSVTNTPEQVVVNPANVSLGLFAGVIIQGTVGYNYTIQSSTALSDPNSWMTLTNIILTAPVEIWDDNSTDVHNGPQKFYKVLPGQ